MFKVLENGKMPTRGSKYSACVDLYASHDCVIGAGETKLIGLGVCIDENGLKRASDRTLENLFGQTIDCIVGTIDGDEDLVHFDSFMDSHYLQLMLRSSLGKKGLILPNGVGVIDLDYKDEIKMIIHNPLSQKRCEKMNLDGSGTYRVPCKHTVSKGDKIGQITLLEHQSFLFGIDSEVERDGGFGSSGSR